MFGPEFDCPPFDGERAYYIVCSPPRTGSELLCRLMADSGMMGIPAEYFNPRGGWKLMAERFGLVRDGKVDIPPYINELKKIRTTPNGVFGFKVQYAWIKPLIDNRLISAHFPGARFIFLTRRDCVAQGVSLVIAHHTREWHVESPPSNETNNQLTQGNSSNDQHPAQSPEYHQGRIMQTINDVLKEEVSWKAFFAMNDIRPYRVEYESLIENTHEVCQDICSHVGVTTDHQFSLDRAPIERQRNDLNEEWIRRIKESAGY